MSTRFKDMTIVMTGKLPRSRAEYQNIIEAGQGKCSTTITKKVTHLVAKDPDGASAKLSKARALGVQIVGEHFLEEQESAACTVTPTLTQNNTTPTPSASQVSFQDGKKSLRPLSGMVLALAGRLYLPSSQLAQVIAAHGGVYSSTVTKKVTHLVSADVEQGHCAKTMKAQKLGIPIVGADFLTRLGEHPPLKRTKKLTAKQRAARRDGVLSAHVLANGQRLPPILKMPSPPRVLLAKKREPKHGSVVGWWCSEKLDGVRGWWDGQQFWSRAGNVFYAPDWFRQGMPRDHTLDGELFLDRNQFRETLSIVKSHKMCQRWQQLTYRVFDIPSEEHLVFEDRMAKLNALCQQTSSPYLQFVDQQKITTTDNLSDMLARVEKLGGEGLMLRKPQSKYEGKRSSTLLKMKSFFDDEAKVIGYATVGQGRLAGMVGSLQLQDRNGVQFDCGSGMTDAIRRNPPHIGTIVTFKYQEKSAKSGRPRFPIYVGEAIDKTFP